MKDGDRLVRSLRASDQLKPSPRDIVSTSSDVGGGGDKMREIAGGRPRSLPGVLAFPEETGREGVLFSLFSSKVERKLEGRLPAPGLPGLLPCLTSRNACAPKLSLRPKEVDEFGGALAVSSSSITAGSSPKLFLNSGEPEADDVARLARRCLAKALKGPF